MTDLHKLVAEKFTSGNSIEVERITITRTEYEAAIAPPHSLFEEIAQTSFINLWQNYCDKKQEVESLKARVKELEAALAQPEPTPRQLQRIRQEAWKNIKQDEYKFDPEVCFAMGFDAGYGAVASKVEPSQEECGGFDSRPAPRKPWVGLTEEERNEMIGRIQHDQYTRQRDLIGSTQIITEMYLKEKNGG